SSAALDSDEVTVAITVNAVNDKRSEERRVGRECRNEGAAAQTVKLTGVDVETAASALTFTVTAAPAHGTLKKGTTVLATNDTFTGSPTDVTYQPDANYSGPDSFKFKVTDTGDGSSAALDSDEVTVAITVNAVNDK